MTALFVISGSLSATPKTSSLGSTLPQCSRGNRPSHPNSVALSLSRTDRYYPALAVFLFAASTTVGLIHTVGVDSAAAHGMSAGTNNDHLQVTVPTSACPGHCSGHLLLGESCQPGLAVGTY